jgi:predicted nucleic acid-binding protein
MRGASMIAGIVLASHAKLATRNVKHFEDMWSFALSSAASISASLIVTSCSAMMLLPK